MSNASAGMTADYGVRTCPKCSRCMCEKFEDKPLNEMASFAIPTGEYHCYWCRYDGPPKPEYVVPDLPPDKLDGMYDRKGEVTATPPTDEQERHDALYERYMAAPEYPPMMAEPARTEPDWRAIATEQHYLLSQFHSMEISEQQGYLQDEMCTQVLALFARYQEAVNADAQR